MAINGSTNGQTNGNGSSNGKHPARASLSEISRGYNLSGGDDDEVFDETESKRTGHTRNDQKDMSRMGKRQELIVSIFSIFFWGRGPWGAGAGAGAEGGRIKKILFCFLECNHSLIDSLSLKKKQRNFRPLSALSFAVVLQATWEFLLM